jgi:hypothetical protein
MTRAASVADEYHDGHRAARYDYDGAFDHDDPHVQPAPSPFHQQRMAWQEQQQQQQAHGRR